MISKTPIYNLKVILYETNLKADVLRAWERRYGLPLPHRTPGGHRLYSEYDIESIKWLQARQAEGLSISHAVQLWKDISNQGKDPLTEYLLPSTKLEKPVQVDQNQLELFRIRWLTACLAFDTIRAEEVVNQAFALFPIELVCFDIMQKGLSEIGSLWYEGKATVQQEHFTSAIAAQRIETLTAVTPPANRQQTILIGCPEGEWHTFPALLLTFLLRRRGLNVIYLGASIPLEKMEQTIAVIHPTLIILSAQQLSTAVTIRAAAYQFQKLGIPFAYGGMIFNRIPALREQIPGLFLGEQLENTVDLVEQILNMPSSISKPVTKKVNRNIAAGFREMLPVIEARFMESIKPLNQPIDNLEQINTFFAAGLSAAFELGNPAFLETDLEWVRKLVAGRKLSPTTLNSYLDAYRQAISQVMGQKGIPITEWIGKYLSAQGKR